MPWAHVSNLQFSLLIASLGTTCVAGGLLAIEFYGSKLLARRVPGVVLVLLLVLGAIALSVGQSVAAALACGGLGIVVLLAWPAQFEGARARIGRFLKPKVIWATLLGISLFASRYLASSVLNSFEASVPPAVLDLADVPLQTMEAVTDKGRPVSLFHFKVHSTADEVQQFIKGNERDRAQLIRLREANPAANCHGWVFTRGQYGVRDGEVEAILTDNDYVGVESPADGDLAIYTTGSNQICHSGIVRIVEKHAPVLIESKWGPFGVYLHGIEAQPFSPTCRFFRSQRATHELELRPSKNAAMAVTPRRTPAPQ